ncbi:MAG: hypothetical protein IJU95_04535, partial [Treponema sp.]|nr:hypothetical protein [Treponema sp.]
MLLPPLFIGPSSHVQAAPRFGWGSAETLAIAFFLYFQILKELERPPCHAFRALSISTVTLGCLMLSYSAVELAALASAKLLGNISPLAASREITGLARWISATAALAAGAFYEECLYRVFLPEIPMLMVCKAENSLISRHKKFFCAGIGTLSLLIFAFSHRYLGWAAVANALMCGA